MDTYLQKAGQLKQSNIDKKISKLDLFWASNIKLSVFTKYFILFPEKSSKYFCTPSSLIQLHALSEYIGLEGQTQYYLHILIFIQTHTNIFKQI